MNKNNIIIILLIILVTLIGISFFITAHNINTNANGKYVTYNFSDTCNVELPKNIKFTDKVSDINSQSNVMGSNVNIVSKSLFGNSEVSQITYSKNAVDGSAVGADLNNSGSNTINGKTVYYRTVMNEATGESVSVIGQNKELVDYIADHVKFTTGKATNKTMNNTVKEISNNDNQQNNNNNNQQQQNIPNEKENKQTTYIGKDGKTHNVEEAYSVDYSSGDLNVINAQRRERGMSEISA